MASRPSRGTTFAPSSFSRRALKRFASLHFAATLALSTYDLCSGARSSGGGPVPRDALLDIYRARADILASHDTDYARLVLGDVKVLCEALENSAGGNCRIWSFSVEGGQAYVFFEEEESQQIHGALCLAELRDAGPGPNEDPPVDVLINR